MASAGTPQSPSQVASALRQRLEDTRAAFQLLEQRGYIVSANQNGKARLSLKLFQLAHEQSPEEFLRSVAVLPMQKLAAALGQSCHLSVVKNGRLLVVTQAESPAPVAISVAEGGIFPLLGTTSGQLLLAYMQPDRRAQLLQRDPEYRKLNESERQRFARWFEAIREAGCLKQSSLLTRGVSDFAVLVGLPGREPMAALTVAMMDSPQGASVSDAKVFRRLRDCARQINRAAGMV